MLLIFKLEAIHSAPCSWS